ncbi:MAG: UxaA family hydrolase [Candidatus Atribacteria bacterium]|nr:UxaA family hydrolase [Candidatus Atribacteria bacterium]
MEETMFEGYLRPDHSVGIRNYLGIIPTVNCCNELTVQIANSLENAIPLPHIGRCVFLGKDQDRMFQLLSHIGKNPNLGAVLVVGSGCEPHSAEELAHEISLSKKPVDFISLKDLGHYDLTVQKGTEIAKILSQKIVHLKKDLFPSQYVTLAIKCGGSDTTSGIAGNIIAGMIADNIVQKGGKVLFTETPELIGAEHILVKRSKNDQVAQKLLNAVQRQEKRMLAMGVDIRRCEPTPGNIQGGLTTIEEKSLGAVAKSGHSVLMDVLESGEKPDQPGLYFIDGPSHTTEIFSNMAAAGAQTLLFSIGGGVPACFPIGPAHSGQFPLMPIIRMTGNPHQPQHILDSMDIDVSSIISEGKNYDEVFPEAIEFLNRILSGEKTKAEKRTSYFEPMNFYFEGPLI